MQDWPEGRVHEMAVDPKAPANKRTAARRWLAAMCDGEGRDPEKTSREAAVFVCDYTHGRPKQRQELTGRDGGPLQANVSGDGLEPVQRRIAKLLEGRGPESGGLPVSSGTPVPSRPVRPPDAKPLRMNHRGRPAKRPGLEIRPKPAGVLKKQDDSQQANRYSIVGKHYIREQAIRQRCTAMSPGTEIQQPTD